MKDATQQLNQAGITDGKSLRNDFRRPMGRNEFIQREALASVVILGFLEVIDGPLMGKERENQQTNNE